MDENIRGSIALAAAVLKGYGATEVYVFGSAASGAMRERSDVDLAVCGLPPESYFRALGDAAVALGRDLNLVDLDEDSPFTRYLREEGELLRVA